LYWSIFTGGIGVFSQEVLEYFHRKYWSIFTGSIGVFTGSLKVFSQEVKYLVYVEQRVAQTLA